MTASTVTLNVGTGGALPLVDTLATVDGSAAPASALVQLVKVGYGAASDFKTVTPATPMPTTSINGLVSTANSTSANLAAGIVFTGTWEDVSEYSGVMLSIFSSHASATDGLSVQFSSNGVDADLMDVYTVPAATGKTYSFGVTAKFYRIVYTNGATLTTALRIQSLLSRAAKKSSSQRPADGRINDNDMEEVLTYPMKWNGVSWDRWRGDIDQSTPGQTNNVALNGQTVTGTLTAAGSVEITNLRGAATVTLEGVATGMTTHTAAMEVLTAAGVWEPAKWIFTPGTAGSITPPANVGSMSTTLAASSARAIVDVAGHAAVRWRSVTFTGTSFAVTMVTSYAPTSRIGPDVDPLIASAKAVNMTLIAGAAIAQGTPASNVTANGAGMAVAALAGSPATAEVASLARTVTGNSGVIADVLGGAISGTLNVTVVSGTAPTLDLSLQESPDNGTTWVDVYHCERVIAVSVITLPSIPLNGRRRWAWVLTGTTQSFTFSVSVNRGGFAQYPRFVQFFDRTAGLLAGTLNAVSANYQATGCRTITASVTIGAATTGGTYKLRGSMDGTNFYDISATVLAVANSTVQVTSTANITARFVQLLCSVAGSGQTGTVVGITGAN